jgi:periplasmic divalent cation tolerance protein
LGNFVIVLTTLPIDADAEQFASQLVEERLAACVNVLPVMKSVYRWQNVVERADERQLIIKTTADRIAALEGWIQKIHPYDVPELLVLSIVQGSADYLSWLAENAAPVNP